jgi:hypothetical protein
MGFSAYNTGNPSTISIPKPPKGLGQVMAEAAICTKHI